MNRIASIVASLPFALATLPAAAEERDSTERSAHPIALALWNPVQTSNEQHAIHGFRLNLPYGANREVYGLDLGIASQTQHDFGGVQLGFGAHVGGEFKGLQANAIMSITRGALFGLQEGIYNSSGQLYGVQTGLVNHVEGSSLGARFAAVNLSGELTRGAEFGIVNHARRVKGLQFGLVNVADELHGVQIGAVNVAKNGFLPFFPVFNSAM